MGLFDKKHCDVCGEKIKLLGNRKLDDGNLCKNCAKDLSPFFSERRRSTVADIKAQLQDREANKAEVAAFNVTRTLGTGTKVLLDEDNGKFIVTSSRNWQADNPDVLNFSQVTGCRVDVNEGKTELKQKDSEGKEVSYNPPRYEYDYDFYVVIDVNAPWFNEIRFRLNSSSITIEPPRARLGSQATQDFRQNSLEYRECEALGEEIRDALTQVREQARESVVAANTPKQAMVCPQCHANTIPDANGRCDYCGGAMLV